MRVCQSTTSILLSVSPKHHSRVAGAKYFAEAEGATEKLALFYLENEVHLVKIAFAGENL